MKVELVPSTLDVSALAGNESETPVRVLCQAIGDQRLYLGLEDGRVAHCHYDTRDPKAKETSVVQNTGHGGAITCILFVQGCGGTDNSTRTHDLVFTGSSDRTIKVWSFKARRIELECIQTLVGHGGTITALDFGGGLRGQRLVSCSTDRTLRIWCTVPHRELLLHPWFDVCQIVERHEWMTSVVLGTVRSEIELPTIYAGDSKGGILVVEPSKGRKKRGESEASLISVTRKRGVTESYDVDRAERYPTHELGIFSMMMLRQLNLVVTVGFDNCVRVFDVVGRAAFLCISNERRCRYTCVSWDSVNHELFCADQDGFIEVWNIYTDKRLMCHNIYSGEQDTTKEPGPCESKSIAIIRENERKHSAILSCTMYSEVTPSYLRATIGGSLYTWTVLRDLNYKEHVGHQDAIVSLICVDEEISDQGATTDPETNLNPRAARQGFQLFSAALDNTLRSWDWYDMRCLFKLREPKSEMTVLARLPDSGILATGNEDGTIRLWSCDTGSTMVLRGHENTVLCLDIAERRRHVYLLSAGYDGKVGIWDVTQRNMIKPKLECMFEAHKAHHLGKGISRADDNLAILQRNENQEILCIRYNPASAFPVTADGTSTQQRPDTFLTGGNDCVIRVWHMTSYTLMCELRGHQEPVTCLEVDANFAISGGDDGRICVWNLAQLRGGFKIADFKAHDMSVRDMTVLTTGGPANLVTCSFDHTVRVWDYIGHSEPSSPKSPSENQPYDTSSSIQEKPSHLLKEFRNVELQFRTLAVHEKHDLIIAGTQEGRLVTFSMQDF